MVIRGGASIPFHAEPPEFIAMAEAAGLKLVRYWPHDWPDGRYNYFVSENPVRRESPAP